MTAAEAETFHPPAAAAAAGGWSSRRRRVEVLMSP